MDGVTDEDSDSADAVSDEDSDAPDGESDEESDAPHGALEEESDATDGESVAESDAQGGQSDEETDPPVDSSSSIEMQVEEKLLSPPEASRKASSSHDQLLGEARLHSPPTAKVSTITLTLDYQGLIPLYVS